MDKNYNNWIKETSNIREDIRTLSLLKKNLVKLNLNKKGITGLFRKIYSFTKIEIDKENNISLDPITTDVLEIAVGDFKSETVRNKIVDFREKLINIITEEIETIKKNTEDHLQTR